MSQGELADQVSELLGVLIYSTAITKIEKGLRSVELEEAVAIADVLEVHLDDLLSRHGAVEARLRKLERDHVIAVALKDDAVQAADQALQEVDWLDQRTAEARAELSD